MSTVLVLVHLLFSFSHFMLSLIGMEPRRVWIACLAFLVISSSKYWAKAAPLVPGLFIFGDSLVDSGNNNVLSSLARADYLPYGIDFPSGSTGRFCNGKTIVDVIAELLGLESYVPPYATTSGQDILKGVNYASATAGIRPETGQQLGDRIDLNGQVQNHINSVSRVVSLLGDESSAADYLSKCIYWIGLGNNDYLNNYFMPTIYTTSNSYTPDQYADALIQDYSQQLKTLYTYGARKVVLVGVGQIGCSPSELAQLSDDGISCVPDINSACNIFNTKLKPLVDQFNTNFPDAKFIYINSYGTYQDLIAKAAHYGFKVTNAGCCGAGKNNGEITCLPFQTPCENRNEYVFWDAFHPTEAANVILARRFYVAESPDDVYPIDVRSLAQL